MQTNSIVIKDAMVDDIPHIQHIANTTWHVAYKDILSNEQLEYMLNLFYSEQSLQQQIKDGHQFLILNENQSAAGFASFNKIDEDVFKLHKLYVLPTIQQKGSGKLLLNEVIERVKKLNAKKLQLNVNRKNKAIGFYEKMGFKIIKEEDINIGNNYFMNDYVMEKKL